MAWLDSFFSGYITIQSAGVPVPQEEIFNFGAGFTVTDNPATGVTTIGFSGSTTSVTGTGFWWSNAGTLDAAAVSLVGDIFQGAFTTNTVPLTVTGLRGAALPALATGVLQYSSGWSLGTIATTSITPGADNTVLITNNSGVVQWNATIPAANVAPGTAGQFIVTSGGATTWTTISGDVTGGTGSPSPGAITVVQAQAGAAICRTDGTWAGFLSSGNTTGYALGSTATGSTWSALTLGYSYVSSGQGTSNGYALGLGAGGASLVTGSGSFQDLHVNLADAVRYIIFEFGGGSGGDGCLSMSGSSANGTGNGVLTVGGLPETSSAYNKLGASGWLTYLSVCVPTGASAADPSGTPANSSVLYCAKTTGKMMLLNKGTSTAIDLSIAGPISGVTISGAGAAGAVPIATSSSAGAWTVPSGDWTWTSSGVATVAKIQGVPFTAGAPTKGQFVLATSTTSYGATSLSGDIAESAATAGLITVTGLQGNTFASGAPTKGQFVVATSTSAYGPVTISGDIAESATTAALLTVTQIQAGAIVATVTTGAMTWATTATPTLAQATLATTPVQFTIQAGNVTTGTGSALVLTSGTGSVAAGAVNIQIGGTTRIGVAATGAVTMSNLGTGIVHSSSAGLLSSSAVALATADVSGVLPFANFQAPTGTGVVTVTAGAWTAASTALSGNGTVIATAAATLASASAGQQLTADGAGNIRVQTTVTMPTVANGGSSYGYLTGGVAGFIEEFMSNSSVTVSATSVSAADTQWSVAPITAGTTGTIASTISTYQNPGQSLITTPATSGNGVALYKAAVGGLGILGANAGWQMDWWFQTPATITNYAIRIGYVVAGQQVADPPTGGSWLEFDTANTPSGTFFAFRTVNASTSNYDTTGSVTPLASTWYHLRIYSTVAGTVNYQLGVANGALSAAVPITTDVDSTHACLPFVQVLPRSNAAATVTVDRCTYVANVGRV